MLIFKFFKSFYPKELKLCRVKAIQQKMNRILIMKILIETICFYPDELKVCRVKASNHQF